AARTYSSARQNGWTCGPGSGWRSGLGCRRRGLFLRLGRDLSDGGQLVALVEIHHPHALGVSARDADLVRVRAIDHALRRDQHEVVTGADRRDTDDGAVSLRSTDVAHAFTATPLATIAHRGAILWLFALGRRRVR